LQQNVCAMVPGRQGIKYIYPTTFAHAGQWRLHQPALRMLNRCNQL